MKKLILILLLLLVAATPILATPNGTCGDNICRADQNEDKLTCPQDCGQLPPSELVFQYITFRPVSVVSNGTDHIEARIEFYFYYYNTTKLVYGTQADATQFIPDANCTYELNGNILQTQHDILDIQYFVQLNVVNDGQYNGLIQCISSLGNKTWPVPFKIKNGRYYSQIISPEEITTKLTVNEINNSGYKNFVNLTEIVDKQQANKPPSFADTMSNFMGLAILIIALFAYTVLSILYAFTRTIQYLFNIGKGAKPPIAAITILLVSITAIAFLPLLILVPVIMTVKIIHKVITAILPKKY